MASSFIKSVDFYGRWGNSQITYKGAYLVQLIHSEDQLGLVWAVQFPRGQTPEELATRAAGISEAELRVQLAFGGRRMVQIAMDGPGLQEAFDYVISAMGAGQSIKEGTWFMPLAGWLAEGYAEHAVYKGLTPFANRAFYIATGILV